MNKPGFWLNQKLGITNILSLFWGFFWLLNGLDKYFNEPLFFGVSRDAKFIEYFSRINLPPSIALTSLYTCGVVEIFLGISFLLALRHIKNDRDWAELNLKFSFLVFLVFCVFDILFGDRAELWEHATFAGLVLVSFLLFRFATITNPIGSHKISQ